MSVHILGGSTVHEYTRIAHMLQDNLAYLPNDDSQDEDAYYVAEHLGHVLYVVADSPLLLLVDVCYHLESVVVAADIPSRGAVGEESEEL